MWLSFSCPMHPNRWCRVGERPSEEGDLDYYSFYPPASGDYVFETTGTTDTELRLYDGNGDAIANDDDSGTDRNARIVHEEMELRGKEHTDRSAPVALFGALSAVSGWAWLIIENGTLKITKTANADLPLAHGQKALLTMDVWEHAYYLDYQNRRPDYISTYLDKLVNWDFVAANLAAA